MSKCALGGHARGIVQDAHANPSPIIPVRARAGQEPMSSAVMQTKEAARLSLLKSLAIFDTPSERAFDDVAVLASQICGAPIALVSLVDGQRQWFKAKVGTSICESPRDVAFCAHAILLTDLFVVPDAHVDPRFADNPLVTGEPHIRFYAGAPLLSADGHALGTLCVIDRVPRQFEPAQAAALRALSRQVVHLLEMRGMVKELRQQQELLTGLVDSIQTLSFGKIAARPTSGATSLSRRPQVCHRRRTSSARPITTCHGRARSPTFIACAISAR